MVMRKYAVGPSRRGDSGRREAIEMPARGPTLAEAKAMIRARKKASRRRVHIPLLNPIKVARGINRAVDYVNRSLAKQSRSMPSERDMNKMIW